MTVKQHFMLKELEIGSNTKMKKQHGAAFHEEMKSGEHAGKWGSPVKERTTIR